MTEPVIVMPGAWRCELHQLWTNGDCPDCDADLIASHENEGEPREGRPMTAPLTTRDAIVRALAEHDWHAADDFDWSRPCRHADHQFSAFCAVCSGDLGLMADALLASGALTDATQARAQAYRDAASIVETFEDGPAAAKALAWMAGEEER